MAKTLDKMTKAELLTHIACLEAQLQAERKVVAQVPRYQATKFPCLEDRKEFIRAHPHLKTFSASDVIDWVKANTTF